MVFYMSDFKERLAYIMKKRCITQTDLSRRGGIPKSAISQYLSGRFKPKSARIDVICGILEVSPAWLMGYEESEPLPLPSLTENEQRLIFLYRSSRKIKDAVDAIINADEDEKLVFRAAKSMGGVISPGYETMSAEQLKKLTEAPETDDDI